MTKKIAIIGCGNMGEALLKGLISRGLFKIGHIAVSDRRPSRLNYIRKKYRARAASSNTQAVSGSDIVILAVKPQDMPDLLTGLGPYIKDKLIISIAAGITTDFIRKMTGGKRIIRAMPNTPALAGCGITVISKSGGAGLSDIKTAGKIFRCVGDVLHLRERYIDAVTAVSGSGPAYFFLLAEAVAKAASSLGIRRPEAERLTAQTAFGAVTLQRKTGLKPSMLRKSVASKGGTTEAALEVFRKRGFEKIVRDAVRAAARRARQLSR